VAKKTFVLANSLAGGGAERQVAGIISLDLIEKVFILENVISYKVDHSKVVAVTSKLKCGRLSKICIIISALSDLRKYGLGGKDTQLICFMQLSLIVGIFAKLLFRCKLVLTLRTNPFEYSRSGDGTKLPLFVLKLMLRYADKVLTNSIDTASEVHSMWRLSNVQQIRNGYDIDEIRKLSGQSIEELTEFFTKNRVLLNVARFSTDKGQWHLLHIIRGLHGVGNVKLALMGDGALQTDLSLFAHSLGLSVCNYPSEAEKLTTASVIFLPFDSNPYKYMSKAFAFVFPSIFEGLPNSPLEALACRLPVVLANCRTGPREILFGKVHIDGQIGSPLLGSGGVLMPAFEPNKQWYSESKHNLNIHAMWISTIQKLLLDADHYTAVKDSTDQAISCFGRQAVLDEWRTFLEQL
jgi:glycosyltransferase involved in cell wall biosynthesis